MLFWLVVHTEGETTGDATGATGWQHLKLHNLAFDWSDAGDENTTTLRAKWINKWNVDDPRSGSIRLWLLSPRREREDLGDLTWALRALAYWSQQIQDKINAR